MFCIFVYTMKIEKLILQRLQDTGRVHLPGWGSWYLKAQVSRWDSVTGTAFPKGKYIAFNPSIASMENSLVSLVMRDLGSTMEIAEQWISRKVQQWQQSLDKGAVLMLDGIGSFRPNGSFQSDVNSLDAQSFGLTPVMLHAISEPSALQSKVVASLKMVSEQREQGLRNWQKASAAAAVSLLFGLGVFQSPWSTQMAGWFATPAEATLEVGIPFVDVENHANETPAITSSESTITSKAVVTTPRLDAGYSIIVGSFKVSTNASDLANELRSQGHLVTILEGSLMKVGVGSFASRDEAKTALSKVKADINSHAWICAY